MIGCFYIQGGNNMSFEYQEKKVRELTEEYARLRNSKLAGGRRETEVSAFLFAARVDLFKMDRQRAILVFDELDKVSGYNGNDDEEPTIKKGV